MSYTINAKSLHAITKARGRIHDEEGSVHLNTHTTDEWLQRMSQSLDEAERLSLWGVKNQALEELAHCLALGVCCLDQHLAKCSENRKVV